MKIRIPEKFKHLRKPKAFKVYYGGRGGAKTVSFSKILLAIGKQSKLRILCLREYMNSIEDSVHSSLEEEVEILGLEDFYDVQKNKIVGRNGTVFRYAGLARNLSSIKSKHAFDLAWIEEASTVSQKSLDVLIPTIRKNKSEIWISFNPDDPEGAVYKEFVHPYKKQLDKIGIYEDEDYLVVKTCLPDNPFATEKNLRDSARLKEKNYKKWLHIYGGECGSNYEDPIFEDAWWQYYEILPDYEYKAIFCDTALKDGQHNDFTVFQCWAKWRGRIYLVDQYRKKIKATDLKQAFIEFWNKHKAQSNAAQPLRAAYVEDKSSGTQLIQDIHKKGGIPIIPVPRPRGNGKVFRANNFSPWIESGLLYLPKKAFWLYTYKQEFEQFSNDDSHAHDDQVDPTLDAIEYMLVEGASLKSEEKKKDARKKTIAPPKDARVW